MSVDLSLRKANLFIHFGGSFLLLAIAFIPTTHLPPWALVPAMEWKSGKGLAFGSWKQSHCIQLILTPLDASQSQCYL